MNCSSTSIQSPLSNWHRIRCMHVMYHIRITYIITIYHYIIVLIYYKIRASILLYTLHIIYPPSTLPSARLFKGCDRFLHVTLEVQGANHHEERDPEPITVFCQIWCYKHATSYGCYGTIHHDECNRNGKTNLNLTSSHWSFVPVEYWGNMSHM